MVEEIVTLLKEKNQLLQKVEEISSKMVMDDIDELMKLDEERMGVIEELKKLDEHVKLIYENSPQADSISRAITNKEDVVNVSEELLPIYESSQANFKIIARLQSFQDEYAQHLDKLRKDILKEIKGNEKSGKVAKYLNALDTEMAPSGSLLSRGSRKA